MNIIAALAFIAALAGRLAATPSTGFQSARDFGCTEWHDCRQLALAAADAGDYERFHDLAWRAIQTGPPKDPALMFLLARAQALSGRPHDALIMLQRLAEMGVPSDVAASDEFLRTRELPGWPEVAALIERVTHSDPPPPPSPAAVTSRRAAKTPSPSLRPAPAAATSPAPPPIPTPVAAPTSVPTPAPVPAPASATAPATETATSPPPAAAASALSTLTPDSAQFSIEPFTFGGLAYDAVSRRFLMGDRLGRKLMVVAEGANHAVDFVRAASAGFRDIAAIEIDGRRGDLWVASAAPGDEAGTLHKLQLVSGRPLKSFSIAASLTPLTRVDLAVTAGGAVLVLDSAGAQLLTLRPGGTAVEHVMKIDVIEPASVAATDDPAIVYVAHRGGLSRIDLRTRAATPVTAPASISLAHLEQIRWRRHALVAIRIAEDGTHRIVRLELNANGRAVTKSAALEGPVLLDGQTFVAISGDELVYIVDRSKDAVGQPRQDASGMADFVAYRVPLR